MPVKEGLLPVKRGRYLRIYRKVAEMSLDDVSQRSGIKLIRLSRIEKGQAVVRENELDILARILNAPIETLRLPF